MDIESVRQAANLRWMNETTVTLQRYQFERAVRNLSKFEAWVLIRAAYNCTREEIKTVYALIMAEN